MAVEIPLFPLGVVLFPHMPLRLHVFEQRYRTMMGDCEENGVGFGVVAIREGLEALGPPATPHPVGTLAQVRKRDHLEDGRQNLVVVGASRFRVLTTSMRQPYLVGEVEYLEDRSGDPQRSAALARSVTAEYRRYADRLRELAGRPQTPLDLPDDPELLSYLVGATLQVEVTSRQMLLEIDSAEDRLRACLTLLRREALLLDRRLARRDPPLATASKN